MKDIIERVSNDIAKEIISRPKFDLEEISGIIKFRIKESMLELLLENVEKEEVMYYRLLVEQSELRLGSPEYIKLGYKLSLAKNRKAIANRAVNNVRSKTKLGITLNYIKENFKDFDIQKLYKILDESEACNGKEV
jgi:hypothetical protein